MRALLELSANNFRSLGSVDVTFEDFNVLVGPNGAGKSNLLDVIRFVGDSVRTDLQPALDLRGGFESVCFRGARSRRIDVGIVTQVTQYSTENAPDEYHLSFRAPRASSRRRLLQREESFKFKRTKRQGRRITIDGSKVEVVDQKSGGNNETETRDLLRSDSLGLATLPRLSDEAGGSQIRQIAELFSTFRVFDVDVAAARRPTSTTSPIETLESDASNLASFLLQLAVADTDQWQRLIDDARQFVPGLEDLHFEPVGGSEEAIAVEIVEQGLPGRTPLANASFGTVRALALLALLYDPDPPLLTCVEEIDHGLHPYVFDRLTDRLREASERTQIIVATHSPALVNRLEPHELIVCERDEHGASQIPAIDRDEAVRIAAAAENRMGLGELWFSGVLGGVPE